MPPRTSRSSSSSLLARRRRNDAARQTLRNGAIRARQGKGCGVLQHRRRLEVLADMPTAYRDLFMQDRGEVEGTAESAHPLSAEELTALTTLANRLSGKKVLLTSRHNPDLLGGVRLIVGNVLYDGSLRAALTQLQDKLQQSSV